MPCVGAPVLELAAAERRRPPINPGRSVERGGPSHQLTFSTTGSGEWIGGGSDGDGAAADGDAVHGRRAAGGRDGERVGAVGDFGAAEAVGCGGGAAVCRCRSRRESLAWSR